MGGVIVVGAGVGGLVTAAALARAGCDVTVLEAQVYPGGCAGTFTHQGFRFDAGATLAGGFAPGGPMEAVARGVGLDSWPVRPTDLAWEVHFPGGRSIERRADEARWAERERAFGAGALPFFHWQETLADVVWPLAVAGLPFPPQSSREFLRVLELAASTLGRNSLQRTSALLRAAARPLARYLPPSSPGLRTFIDGQLLLSVQTTSGRANALFGAAALDLPRRGVVHVSGGMGGLAHALAHALVANGGQVHYRQRVERVRFKGGRPAAVETVRGGTFPADLVIFNLPAPDIRRLLAHGDPARARLSAQPPTDGWGAFTLYLGVEGGRIPHGFPLHHQLIRGGEPGEGRSLFLSLSPTWDDTRAPAGRRAITISAHTRREDWWTLFENDRAGYEARKRAYTVRILEGAERILPGLRSGIEVALPGTPVTFQRFTGRGMGWVGGYPQTHLLRTQGPRLGPALWRVGDGIFPGQSTAAVALGGLRVASAVLGEPLGELAHTQGWGRRRTAAAEGSG